LSYSSFRRELLVKLDRTTLALLIAPPVLAGVVLGANQTRAGAYLPWLLSIGYWVSISLITWLSLAVGTIATHVLLRPWSPPAWLCWLAGAVAGSLMARPLIYSTAAIFRPMMQAPVLREMPPMAPTAEFLGYYITNWSVIIAMWLAACWLTEKWRHEASRSGDAVSPDWAEGDGQWADNWENDAFLRRIPNALGRDILALHSEDHYVRVYTRHGDALILAAISDAVRALELNCSPGQRVHRSWWVANGAISGSEVRGRKLVVSLANGIEVPISQTYREIVKVSGLVKTAQQAR
jgi:LytTr DNA-binding domain